MKTFIAQGMEIAECELVAEGFPISQQGAEMYATKAWSKMRKLWRNRHPWKQSIRSASGSIV